MVRRVADILDQLRKDGSYDEIIQAVMKYNESVGRDWEYWVVFNGPNTFRIINEWLAIEMYKEQEEMAWLK